ncbi:MAG: Ataxin-3-like protein [Amphiamblys sp. WSBS2006]|nr:MAG: Ataxin-3-like protein [Amphiamblys sp. WSBS2006]
MLQISDRDEKKILEETYFEKQENTLLCGQHCLNNLLQQEIFDSAVLAEIGTELNRTENEISADRNTFSHVNEYGFFSSSVLEVALNGLSLHTKTLKREWFLANKNYFDNIEGLICNKSEHWFCLRKLGGVWLLLDSKKDSPVLVDSIHPFLAGGENTTTMAIHGLFPSCVHEKKIKEITDKYRGKRLGGSTEERDSDLIRAIRLSKFTK